MIFTLFYRKHKIEEDSVDGAGPSKKIKKEDDTEEKEKKEEIKKQNKIMYKYRDELEQLSKQELKSLLEFNDQQIPPGKSEVYFFALLFSLYSILTNGSILLGAWFSCWYHDLWILGPLSRV